MLIKDFLRAFNQIVPLASAAYEKDAVGLQVGYQAGTELEKVLLAYEVTDEVIDEAIGMKANLIISYHPLIFPNVNSITDATRTGSLLRRLVQNDLALYVIHTAFDSHPEFGTSAMMAQKLGLINPKPLVPLKNLLEKIVVFVPNDVDIINRVREAMWNAGAGNISNYDECSFSTEGFGTFRGNASSNPTLGIPEVRETVNEIRIEMICEKWKSADVIEEMTAAHTYEEVAYDRYPLTNSHPKYGMGTIGMVATTLDQTDLLDLIETVFETSVLRYSKRSKQIRHIAMVGGAGMEYYTSARNAGADAFITGDIRYHDFYRAEHDGLLLIDAGHSETERFVLDGMQIALERAVNVVILQNEDRHRLFARSLVRPNAVCYHINKGKL